MARLAFSLILISSLILLSHAHRLRPLKSSIFPSNHLADSITDPKIRLPSNQVAGTEFPGSDAVTIASDDHLQPDQLENQVVEWKTSTSNDLPDSSSELAIYRNEDSVPSEALAESEPINFDKSTNKCGSHFHFDFLRLHFHFHFPSFHFHSHCHRDDEKEMEIEKKFEPRLAGEEIPYTEDMLKARTAWFPEEKSARHHHRPVVNGEMKFEEGKMKIHKKKCKKEKEDDEAEIKMKHHKEWRKEKEDHDDDEDDEDDKGIIKVEEGKMKRHEKGWKKGMEEDEGMMQRKRHKKVWKKEKEDGGLKKLFRKLFKRCRRKLYKLFS